MTNKTVVDPTKPATIGEINNDLDHPIDMEQLWAADQHDDRFDRLGSEQAETRADLEIGLAGMRQRLGLTQTDLARAIGMTQPEISRIEHQPDLLLSTLRSYIAGLGGQLSLVATIPGQSPITVTI